MTGVSKGARASEGEPTSFHTQTFNPETIPENVYWRLESGNFYDYKGNCKGNAFYKEWHPRRQEFPVWYEGEAGAAERYKAANGTRPAYITPEPTPEARGGAGRVVQNYKADDGSVHPTLEDAICQDLYNLFEEKSEMGLVGLRMVVAYLTKQPMRAQVMKLLKELG